MYKENISGRLAFISGASAGIGEAVAKMLASNGVNLILTARRIDRLENLKNSLEVLNIKYDNDSPEIFDFAVKTEGNKRIITFRAEDKLSFLKTNLFLEKINSIFYFLVKNANFLFYFIYYF